ncbi:MAG: Fic family protein [Ruminococcaceae bacterium]|nr:Fic family protein [Oscillospiraceae bacterium]
MNFRDRAGYFMKGNGFNTFVPNKLPPNPPIEFDAEMQNLLSLADRKLGRLDGVTQILPNPDLFVAMYVRKEAVLSSQIEGTQASFADVLSAEYNQLEDQRRDDIGEISNYVTAMNWGLQELSQFPLSLRLIRNIHQKLLQNTRGSHKNPGEFRKSQNWIGPAGCTLNNATFVPPSVTDMEKALGELEQYFYEEDQMPALVKIALIHAQFESIHPFLDGNGRMGRLLITFWLCQQEILTKPLLYLSYYFKQNRSEYYDRLMDVRKKGNWEDWIKFFLRGVAEVSDESTESAREILQLQKDCSDILIGKDGNNSYYQKLLNYLFEYPFVRRNDVMDFLKVTNPTAGSIIDVFCDAKILYDLTPDKSRNKLYGFSKYIAILNKGTELAQEEASENTMIRNIEETQ